MVGETQEEVKAEYSENEIGSILQNSEQLIQAELHKKNQWLESAN
jgi:hypothetical protein